MNCLKRKNTTYSIPTRHNIENILINYISLNDYDKKIAFDLVQKLNGGSKELGGGDRNQATMVFEKII